MIFDLRVQAWSRGFWHGSALNARHAAWFHLGLLVACLALCAFGVLSGERASVLFGGVVALVFLGLGIGEHRLAAKWQARSEEAERREKALLAELRREAHDTSVQQRPLHLVKGGDA